MKRKIISIDNEACNGCGLCMPNCPEGALQMIDGKARLISDLFCDGLGACLGHCPQGAIRIEEREAEDYSEARVMENIIKQGPATIQAHLRHLLDHGEKTYHAQALAVLQQKNISIPQAAPQQNVSGCPGSRVLEIAKAAPSAATTAPIETPASELGNWPVQLMLAPTQAAYFENADLLLAADCVPFAYAGFHSELLRGRVLLIACPKLDDKNFYVEKLAKIFRSNAIRSLTIAHMEVPCCFGLVQIVKAALVQAEKNIPLETIKLSLQGKILEKVAG